MEVTTATVARTGMVNPVASAAQTSAGSQSWMAILKSLHNHSGAHRSGINPIQSSTDEGVDGFGVASTSDDTSVDSFGTPSVQPSSTSQLVASISDPFSSIASNVAVQAQLGSPQSFLDL